ncbi:hypothetical protein J3F84DRAFT_389936 [Trichoderma pleuroticola]
MFKFIRKLTSRDRTSSNRSGQPTRQNATPRHTPDGGTSIHSNPPPYHPTFTTSRDSATHAEDADLSYDAAPQSNDYDVLLSTGTQHHRETSTGTSVLPLNEEDAASRAVVIHPPSQSNPICTCTPRQGCCIDHNSIRVPNPAPPALLGTSCHDSTCMSIKTAYTLKPIHYCMEYHLSLENLECTRLGIRSETETMFIPELSFAGSACSEEETQYRWSSEVYFDKGTFLQIQEIRIACYKNDESPPEHFIGCPHQSLTVYTPEFNIQDGMLEAETWVTSIPSRCPSHPMQKWSSLQGPYTHITSCTICHSDTECYMQINGHWLDVRYTCFRDLGAGTDSNDPKWHSLLTGGGIAHRPRYKFEVLTRVWDTALKLKRSTLEAVSHETPNGMFSVRSGFRNEQ